MAARLCRDGSPARNSLLPVTDPDLNVCSPVEQLCKHVVMLSIRDVWWGRASHKDRRTL